MKRQAFARPLALLLVLLLAVSLAACGGGSSSTAAPAASDAPPADSAEAGGSEAAAAGEQVVINFPNYQVGTNLGAPAMEQIIEEFEAANPNIKVEIEEIPTDQAYLDKMKILAASGDLPDVLEGKNGLDDVLAQSGNMVNLMPYIEEDAEWRADLGEESIAINTVGGGETYFACITAGSAGYYYNKDYFEQVGIKPAETWDEFMENCEKLKAAGITPLALMSSENAWTTNLFLAAKIGTDGQAGNDFMNTMYPRDFETPEVIEGLAMIQTLFKEYTTADALGAAYANAANNFMQGKTAMIANGPWMIADFKDDTKALPGFYDQVGIATYPGSGVFSAPQKGGYGISTKNPDKLEASLAFVKALTNANAQKIRFESFGQDPLTDRVQMTEEYRAENPLVAELQDKGAECEYKFAWFDIINYANVTDAFKNLYPELAYDQITPEEMAARLSEVAQSNKEG